MSDPITVTVLGAAFTESIRFLYGQASDLLKARRERRTAESEDPIVSEVPDSVPLGAHPGTLVADGTVLDEYGGQLAELAARLHPFAEQWRDPDPEAEAVAGDLRALLEAVYGKRLTFVGEQREPTGTKVSVRQVVDEVGHGGRLIGAVTTEPDGDADVYMRIGNVTGEAIGHLRRRDPNG